MSFKDPVCGKRINRGKAHITIEFEVVNYFLCCPQCQAQLSVLQKPLPSSNGVRRQGKSNTIP